MAFAPDPASGTFSPAVPDDDVRVLTATLSQPRAHETLGRRPTGMTLEVVTEGPLLGQRFELPNRSVVTGGRAPSHDVVLDDESVSTTHFEIRLEPRGVMLRDLGSTNGTWIARSRLEEGVVSLFDGAAFYAGNIKLRLVDIEIGKLARSTDTSLGTMAGRSPAMAELFALLSRLAPTPITTLVTGETGTGKEEVARTLHQLSERKGPFVVLDCGALAPGLAESAIYGHVKGAFTGASSDTPGAFERAHWGTLLLDEIGELPLDLQPKLLRVLDRREVLRIGDTAIHPVDVRVIAATNRNLAQLVADGEFRLDLYHRLRQLEINVPPLRTRPEDIPLLVHWFLARFHENHGRAIAIEESAVEILTGLHWEGNVRQLQQTIHRLAFLAEDDVITVGDLRRFGDDRKYRDPRPDQVASHLHEWMSLPYKEAVDRFQVHYFRGLFDEAKGDVDEICRRAGYSRKGLQGLARRIGFPWPGDNERR